jgi:SAM-dependent methyltransferase
MATMDPRRATAFGRYAHDYDRWRPTYPDAAVAWLLPSGASRVADVGAGTGKLTGHLVARGLDVAAVEPDGDMLAVLRSRWPGVRTHQAGADRLPLDDASVDAVLVGTAWHWFPHEAAVAQVRRVLRPGGRLGLLWNGPTRTDEGWAAELTALDPDAGPKRESRRPGATGLPVEELESATFDWTWDVDADAVRGYFGTHSGVVTLADDDRGRHLDRVHAIVTAACAAAGAPTVPWRQTTECVRWTPGESGQQGQPGPAA